MLAVSDEPARPVLDEVARLAHTVHELPVGLHPLVRDVHGDEPVPIEVDPAKVWVPVADVLLQLLGVAARSGLRRQPRALGRLAARPASRQVYQLPGTAAPEARPRAELRHLSISPLSAAGSNQTAGAPSNA